MKKEKITQFCEWYIKGYYHCDKCPYSWEERGMEDADAGCYIYGDIRDTCRLLPPFKGVIGRLKRRSWEYWQESQYDGIGEWYEEYERKEREFKRLLLEFLEKYQMCYAKKDGTPITDIDGNICWVDKESVVESDSFRMRCDYEDFIAPKGKTLGEEWAEVLKRTWETIIRPIKPFLPKISCGRKRNDN